MTGSDRGWLNSRWVAGVGVTTSFGGVSHFFRSDAFAVINRKVFGCHRRSHSYVNGAIETIIGLGLLRSGSRRLVLIATLPYPLCLRVKLVRTTAAHQATHQRSNGHSHRAVNHRGAPMTEPFSR